MIKGLPYDSFPCTECNAGQMRPRMLTYYTWIGDDLISVPDFPAWICDMCGRREYDASALNQLVLLLNPNAGKPSPKARPVKRPSEGKNTRPSRPE